MAVPVAVESLMRHARIAEQISADDVPAQAEAQRIADDLTKAPIAGEVHQNGAMRHGADPSEPVTVR